MFLFGIALIARVIKTVACRIHDQRGVADFFFLLNQQSEYNVFYELMCWLSGSLTCRLPNVVSSPPARRSREFNHC